MFRHQFVAAASLIRSVEEVVVRLLKDSRVEVRELASSTLAAMLRTHSEPDLQVAQSVAITRLLLHATKLRLGAGS